MMRGAAGALVAILAALLCCSADAYPGLYGRTLFTYSADALSRNRNGWRRSAGPIVVRPVDNELTGKSDDPAPPNFDEIDQSGLSIGGGANSGRRCLGTDLLAKLLFGLTRRQGHDSDDQGDYNNPDPPTRRRPNLLRAPTRRNDDDDPPPGNFDEIDSSPLDMGG